MKLVRKILLGDPPYQPAALMLAAEALVMLTLLLALWPSR
jgi:hypothetical protein